ncbi:tape measure protein [Oenococcus sicerae]|uniref:tape measure protein n=1 Tax=Oenococcus sicerae TaxID=2203724 RepID=UPI0039E8FBAF
MASDGQVIIDLLFPGNKAEFHTDAESAQELLNRFGAGTGKKMDEDFKSNTEKVKSSAKETKSTVDSNAESMGNGAGDKMGSNFKKNTEKMGSDANEAKNKVNSNLSEIKKEVYTKLIASAEEAGIKNFRTLLGRLPKEEVTRLEAKVQKGEEINWREEMSRMPKEVVTKMKLDGDQATVGLSKLKEEADNTGNHFHRLRDIIVGSFVGQMISQGVRSLITGLKDATQAGMEYNKEQDTMKTVWTSLTTEAPKDGKVLVDYINSLSSHSIYAASTIDKMAQSFYHVHSNVAETKSWTDSFVALGSTLHMTNDALAESGEQFAKIVAGGKASAEDMSVMINRFPMFGEALQQATGKSMKQLYAMSAAGKLTATQFTEALDFLGKKYKSGTDEAMTSFMGMSMFIKSRWETLWGDITKTSFNMSKKARGDIRDLLSDDMLKKYANGVSVAISSITGWVTKLLDYINNHKTTIIDIIGNMKTLLGIVGSTVWHTFIDFVYTIAQDFGLVSAKSKDAKDPLKEIDDILKALIKHKDEVKAFTQVLITFFAVKKATEFLGVMTNILGTLKGITGLKMPALFGESATSAATVATPTVGVTAKTAGASAVAGDLEKTVASSGNKWALLGSSLGARLVNGAGLALAGWDVGKSILSAANSNSAQAKYSAAGKTAGTLIGGTIGAVLGGPGGAMIGAGIGDQLGSTEMVQNAVKKLTKSWNEAVNGVRLEAPKMSNKKAYDALLKEQQDYYKKKEQQDLADAKLLHDNGEMSDAEYSKRVKAAKNYASDMEKQVRKSGSDQVNIDKYYASQKQDIDTNYNKKRKEIHDKYDIQVQNAERTFTKNSTQYRSAKAKEDEALDKASSEHKKQIEDLNVKYATTDMLKEAKAHETLTGKIQLASDKQISTLNRLGDQKGKLSLKSLNSTIKDATKESKETVALAEKSYTQKMKAAEKSYNSVMKVATREQNDVIKAADKKEKDTIAAASRQYQGNSKWAVQQRANVTKQAQKEHSDTVLAAMKKYSETKAQAEKQYSAVSKAAEKQKEDVVKKANQQRDETVKQARQQKEEILKQASNQYNETTRKASDQYRDVVKSADRQYKEAVDRAKEQYKGNSSYAQSQRDFAINAAKVQRDNVVSHAEKQKNDVSDRALKQYKEAESHAEEQRKSVTDKANRQRDEVKNSASDQGRHAAKASVDQANDSMEANSKQGKGVQGIWNGIKSFFNKFLKFFGLKEMGGSNESYSYSPAQMHGGYAIGGKITQLGQALVGEAGPELRYKPYSHDVDVVGSNGPEVVSVSPGEQILNATDTAKVFSGNYGRTLPGYANGNISLSDFLKKLKNGASDIWDKVSDTASDALDKLTNPEKTITDIASKAFNLDSVANLGSVPRDISKGIVKKEIKSVSDYLKKLKDSFDNGGGSASNPGGAGVARWKPYIEKAAKQMHVDLTGAGMKKILNTITHESGGDPTVKQGVVDVNTGVDPAVGLLQFIGSTFRYYAVKGHTNRSSGYDQLLALFNDKNWLSDLQWSGGWGPTGGRRFANGGFANQASIFGEDGLEAATPLRADKADVGYAMLGKTAAYMAARDNLKVSNANNFQGKVYDYSAKIDSLGKKLDAIAQKQLKVDGSSFSKSYESYGTTERARRNTLITRGVAVNANI